MPMALQTLDLWSLVLERPQIDPYDLAEAIVNQATDESLDYRSRMLLHDSVDALRSYWGPARTNAWLKACPARERIETICQEEFDKIGFPSLRRRVMDKTKPDTVRSFFEHLGKHLHRPVRLYVAGSIALILPGYLSRRTEDIDVIDEVPEVIRKNHALVESLQNSYNLHLGHVQSHYFPSGWQDRCHSLAPFGRLEVFLLDVYDVFLSKLFSSRLKDMEDMRVLLPQLDKDVLIEKLKNHAQGFLAAPRLLQIAKDNWKILYGEELPQ
jgi:Nucleotidyltransferase of unknown function (DUF6036)